jgi:hypothetical protein
MRMVLDGIALLGWGAFAAGGLAACGGGPARATAGSGGGGSDGGSAAVVCGEHPRDCPAGETCWFASGGAFTCQPSGEGKAGEACSPLVGQPTCADGLLCIRAGSAEGACTPLCDPAASDTMCGDLLCVLVMTADGGETHACN